MQMKVSGDSRGKFVKCSLVKGSIVLGFTRIQGYSTLMSSRKVMWLWGVVMIRYVVIRYNVMNILFSDEFYKKRRVGLPVCSRFSCFMLNSTCLLREQKEADLKANIGGSPR